MTKNIDLKKLWNEVANSLDTDKEEITEELFVSFFNDTIDNLNSLLKVNYYHIENTNNFYIGIPNIMHSLIKKGIKLQYYDYDGETEGKIQRIQSDFNNFVFTFINYNKEIPIQFRSKNYRNIEDYVIQKYLYYNNSLDSFNNLSVEEKNEFVKNNVYIDDGYKIFKKLYRLDSSLYTIKYENNKIIINWEKAYKNDTVLYLSDFRENYKKILYEITIDLITSEEIE